MYRLTLSETDARDIATVGHRYAWAEALAPYGAGDHKIPEHKAWELAEAFESDTEGGHAPFPMLDLGSDLAGKLFQLWDSII